MGGGGSKRMERIAEQQAAEERARQARIRAGMGRIDDVFRKFDDDFFNQVRRAQLDFILPDISRQFNQAREQLAYALARGGNLRSTLAAERGAELAEEHRRALTQADSAAEQEVRRARQDIENERSMLVAELQATADPEAAASAARARAGFLQAERPLQSIGPLFQNITAGIASALRPRYDEYGVQVGRGFSWGGGRSRVVGGGR